LNRLTYNTSRLIHVLPEEGLDFLIALALNLGFVALVALLLLPLGKAALALCLTKGYGVLWLVTVLTAVALHLVQKSFRVDTDTHYDALVVSNLAHAVFLLTGWSAFAALTVRSFVSGAPLWVAAILWLVGLLSSHVAFVILSSFYPGRVYKVVNAPAALISFLVFAVYPAGGRALYGWFFNLF
jgi:hypothetical protein